MKKNLVTIKQNNKLMLKKSKSLLATTNSILTKDDWIKRLWLWADKNNVPDLKWREDGDYYYGGYEVGLIRDKKILLSSTVLNIRDMQVKELPKEIGNLTNLITLYISDNKITETPKEIGNLTNLTSLDLSCNKITEIPKEIGNLVNLTELLFWENQLVEIPKEIGNLINLETFNIHDNQLTKFPKEIVNLTNLTSLDFQDNPNLILTEEQKEWITALIDNRCHVMMTDEHHREYKLARRYKYLDEFNIGREVPITTDVLNNDIPDRINSKLAEGEVTFEKYLDEVSDYLYQGKFNNKNKFNDLVQKIYDRDYDLGACFERNIAFESFEDNKLT